MVGSEGKEGVGEGEGERERGEGAAVVIRVQGEERTRLQSSCCLQCLVRQKGRDVGELGSRYHGR